MNKIDPGFLLRSRTAFLTNAPASLKDIRDKVAAEATGTAKRDMLSAFDTFERLIGRPLSTVRADAKTLRQMLRSKSGLELGLSQKRYANVCSSITSAVRTYGAAVPPITQRIPLSQDWAKLLQRVEPAPRRMALYRLACFCTFMGIAPEAVNSATLEGFYAALDAEEVVKHPKKVLKHTVAHWNMCRKAVPGWPDIKLASPVRVPPYTLPLAAFPASFQEDVAKWVARVSKPNPFDPKALKKPLKQPTIDGYIMTIRRFASALVHRKVVPLDQIDVLGDLFIADRLEQGLTFFVERTLERTEISETAHTRGVTAHIAALAHDMRNIAKHHCKLAPDALQVIIGICDNLDSLVGRQLSETVRRRLRQFDDPENVKRLLELPAKERARGLKSKSPIRQARFMERALAIDLLIHFCLRIKNLRTINLETNIYVANGKAYLTFKGEHVKNGRQLDFELPEPVADALAEFIEVYRPRLEPGDSPYLFVGANGGPKSHGAMRTAISACLKKQAGLEMHPHLFRHAIGKIVVEQDPGAYAAFSQHLGHARLDTTLSNYLGTETRAAGRHVNGLLTKALAEAKDKSNGKK